MIMLTVSFIISLAFIGGIYMIGREITKEQERRKANQKSKSD